MRVRVLYFGVLQEMRGVATEEMELPPGETLRALMGRVRGTGDERVWGAVALAVNREYMRDREHVLHEGDEVALLPPVSGGWDASVQRWR